MAGTIITEKPLAQYRPSTTDAVGIYSPDTGVIGIIKTIIIANTTATDQTYQLFLDIDGSDYSASTYIGSLNTTVLANRAEYVHTYLPMNSSSNFAVQANTANAITFSVFGVEIK